MFQPGDLVVYGNDGVCRVESVGPLALSGLKSDKLYYTLTPLYQQGRVFAPVEGKVFIRPILTREEAEELIRSFPEIREDDVTVHSSRLRSERYQQLVRSHHCEDLVQLIKTVYLKRQEAEAAGRRGGQVEERYRKRAEELLYGELAASLGIGIDEVEPYIFRILGGAEEGEAQDVEAR